MIPRSAVVVGAGLAGIASALELARRGVRVNVLEAADRPGGRAQRWEQDGFRFDLGPTLIVLIDVLKRSLGADAFDSLELQRLEPGYRVNWTDGTNLEIHSDIALALAEFERFQPGVSARMLAYLAEVHDAYVQARAQVLEMDHTYAQFFGAIMKPGRVRPWIISPLRSFVQRYVRHPRIVQALTFQPLYLGTSPLKSPAMHALLGVEEIIGGVWYPRGGSGAIVDTLIRECTVRGVEFTFDARVERISTKSDGSVRCEFGGRSFESDALVVASDREPSLALFNGAVPKARSPRYGHSAIVWYWGINKVLPLTHHSILLPDDPWKAYAQIDAKRLPDEPMLYLCNPAATDPGCAPAGGSALLALAPIPNRADLPEFDERAFRDRVLERIERAAGPFRDGIVVERVRGPREFERELGLMHGAAFGPDHTLDQMGPFRPPIAHPTMRNVVFAGSGTRPGSGVPMVLISARLAAERLCR
jgi:phytoene desaturase